MVLLCLAQHSRREGWTGEKEEERGQEIDCACCV